MNGRFNHQPGRYALYVVKLGERKCVIEYELFKRKVNGELIWYDYHHPKHKIRGTMKDNEWDGVVSEWNKDGYLVTELNLKEGIREGEQMDGRIESIWKDGALVEYSHFTEDVELMDDKEFHKIFHAPGE